jgi:hypothetical protein
MVYLNILDFPIASSCGHILLDFHTALEDIHACYARNVVVVT